MKPIVLSIEGHLRIDRREELACEIADRLYEEYDEVTQVLDLKRMLEQGKGKLDKRADFVIVYEYDFYDRDFKFNEEAIENVFVSPIYSQDIEDDQFYRKAFNVSEGLEKEKGGEDSGLGKYKFSSN